MITAVVSYHRNALTCGVARFSQDLARRLGVPCVGFDDPWGECPLLSLKWSEISARDQVRFYDRCEDQPYVVFWHDRGILDITEGARAVFSGDPTLPGSALWCPPTLPLRLHEPYDITLLTFGMAHKLHVEPYRKVRQLLEAAHLSYRLKVSVGLHEGTTIDQCAMHLDALEDIFGAAHMQMLGSLSDLALAEQMQAADLICAFFPKGVRANNTSVHTAMAMGRPLLTNLDHLSPKVLHGAVFDLATLTQWPDAATRRLMAIQGLICHMEHFTWPTFLHQFLQGLYATTDDRPAAH